MASYHLTTRLDGELPLRTLGARSGLLWSRDGLTLAGVGRALEIPVDRPGGFASAQATLAAVAAHPQAAEGDDGVPVTGPVAFAALPFDPDRPGSRVVPHILVGADRGGRRWMTVTTADDGFGGHGATEVMAQARRTIDEAVSAAIDGDGAAARDLDQAEPTDYRVRSVLDPAIWRDEVVPFALRRIADGALTKAVLARELVLTTDRPLDPAAVVERLHTGYPRAALFLVDGFVGASPELLVARRGDMVRAHPLAGTAARASDPVIDQRRTAELLGSEKDRWEHRITIDWLLDNLLPFCSYVDAEPEPSIVTMANVHHLGTKVDGRLTGNPASVLELVAALHPTPALGGSPQKEALSLIAELERSDRGCYGGPVGWVDGSGDGEFAVGIRSAQIDGTEARFFAGVGVVANSNPAAELAETQAKFRAMLGALIVP